MSPEDTRRIDAITNNVMAACAAMGADDTHQLTSIALCLLVKILGYYPPEEREEIYQETVYGLRLTLEKNHMLKPRSLS
jgi:hypothetical protein